MYHSVIFGNKNTYDDWKIVPTSRPVIPPPEPNFNFVEVPGANGSLDLTEVTTGTVTYKDRTGSLDFIVLNETISWEVLYSEIMRYLHGRQMKMILEDDPFYFYEGRFSVDAWKSSKGWPMVTISYTLKPLKYELNESTISKSISSASTFIIPNNGKPIVPSISLSAECTAQYKNRVYNLPSGVSQIVAIIDEGDNSIIITPKSGAATVNITYRRGIL